MSTARVCDKCRKPIIGPPKETDVPDYVATLEGKPLVVFEDLCQVCRVRVVTNTDKYIAVGTRQRSSKSDKVSEKQSEE